VGVLLRVATTVPAIFTVAGKANSEMSVIDRQVTRATSRGPPRVTGVTARRGLWRPTTMAGTMGAANVTTA
jgi:hypothetical protein